MGPINVDIKEILTEAAEQIKQLALEAGDKYKDVVIYAGYNILQGMQSDLKIWSEQLANGEISVAEFDLLVKSYKVEIMVAGLQQVGIGEVRSVELAESIIETIIVVAVKIINRLIASA